MSNQFQGITSGLANLKNYYEGPIVSALSDDVRVYRAAEKVKKGWSGYQVVRNWKVRRNPGIGATSDGGPLPKIGRQTNVQAIFSSAFNYLRFGITGPMIEASRSDIGSFVRQAAYELTEGYNDLQSDMNRQMSWDGTGDLALVNTTAVSSTTLVIKGRETAEAAIKFLDVGINIDIYSGSTKVASSAEITAISGGPNDATATLTLSIPVSATAGDVLVREGSFGQEVLGLLYALDGGTSSIYQVDRSLYPATQGNVTDLSTLQNPSLTLDAMQTPWNNGLRRGGKKYSAIWTDFDSIRFYQKLLIPDKRYAGMEGDGSFGNKGDFYLDFNSTAVVPDKDCPRRMFFLPAEALKNYVLAEMKFADETGSMYIAQNGADALEVRVRLFNQLFNEKPSACGVLTGYTSP